MSSAANTATFGRGCSQSSRLLPPGPGYMARADGSSYRAILRAQVDGAHSCEMTTSVRARRRTTSEDRARGVRVERAERLVEDQHVGVGEQCAGEAQPGALALGQAPAGLADDLPDPGGHAPEQRAEAELLADRVRLLEVVRAAASCGPSGG